MKTFFKTKQLQYFKIRVPKDEAYFVYFTLESNEGLCHYSTCEDSLKAQYRDIDLYCTPELKTTVLALLEKLQTQIRLDFIAENEIKDS